MLMVSMPSFTWPMMPVRLPRVLLPLLLLDLAEGTWVILADGLGQIPLGQGVGEAAGMSLSRAYETWNNWFSNSATSLM